MTRPPETERSADQEPEIHENVLPTAWEEEPEALHPAVGESWVPKSRDDHMRGLRGSVPDVPPEHSPTKGEAGFFGAISDAFDLSHDHLPDASLPPAERARSGR